MMDEAAHDCPLCLFTIPTDDLYVTKCNHRFHSKCFCEYVTYTITQNKNPIVCPLCKQGIEDLKTDVLSKVSIIINDNRIINSCTKCKMPLSKQVIIDLRKKYNAYHVSIWVFALLMLVLTIVMVVCMMIAIYVKKKSL